MLDPRTCAETLLGTCTCCAPCCTCCAPCAGQPDFELLPGGADVMVDSSNLGAWIDAVVDATLGSGVAAQLEACRQGFNEVRACVSAHACVCIV